MKRIISVICCCVLLSAVFTGCAKEKPSTDTDTDVTSTVEDTAELYDANGYLKDSIPDTLDYDGATVRIVGWADTEASKDFNVDTSTGDPIAYQTFARNETVKERLNVKLDFILDYNGNNANRYDYISTIEKNLMSGETYDIIACYSQNVANFATDGYLVDLMSESDAIKIDKPWWSADLAKNSVINNKLYFASGSISATNILETMIIAINQETVAELGVDDPRQLVKQNAWTLEAFYQMCNKTYVDLNAEVQGKDEEDKFGFAMCDSTFGDGFLASTGLHYLSTDNTGKLIISPDFKGEKIYNIAKALIDHFKTDDYYYQTKYVPKVFTQGRAMLYGTDFGILMNLREEIDFNYGFVPFPKADTDQTDYYSCSGFPFTMWCITTQCSDTERAAYVMEALASAGYRMVQPAVYENIKYRGNTDEINVEMFDIIMSSKTYDMGRVFHNNFVWDDSPVALFRSRMYKYDGIDWYSALAGKSNAIEGVLASINSSFGY